MNERKNKEALFCAWHMYVIVLTGHLAGDGPHIIIQYNHHTMNGLP